MTGRAAPDAPPQLGEFVALYAAGRFFDAHEVLEEVWRRSDEPPMPFPRARAWPRPSRARRPEPLDRTSPRRPSAPRR